MDFSRLNILKIAESSSYTLLGLCGKYFLINTETGTIEYEGRKLPEILTVMMSSETMLNQLEETASDNSDETIN